jgi:hypothetical protein
MNRLGGNPRDGANKQKKQLTAKLVIAVYGEMP